MAKSQAIGIDFGGCNCRVAVVEDGKVTVIRNDLGNVSTPTYISFWEEERVIGERAKEMGMVHPESIVCGIYVLQLLGKDYGNRGLQESLKYWPFDVVQVEGRIMITVESKAGKREFHPEELAAMLLYEMKKLAENHLGTKVTSGVITIPNLFTLQQQHALKQAAKIAGFEKVKLIPATAAACIWNEFDKHSDGADKLLKSDKYVTTYSFGGCSREGAVFRVFANGQKYNEVNRYRASTVGQQIDRILLEEVLKRKDELKLHANIDKFQRFKILQKCEQVKIENCIGESPTIFGITAEEERFVKAVKDMYSNEMKKFFTGKNSWSNLNQFVNIDKVSIDERVKKEAVLFGGMAANSEVLKYHTKFPEGWNSKKHSGEEIPVSGAAIFASTNLDFNVEPIELCLRHSCGYKIYEQCWSVEHSNCIGTIKLPLCEALKEVSSISVELDIDVDALLTITVSSSEGGYKASFRYPDDFHDTNLLSDVQLRDLTEKETEYKIKGEMRKILEWKKAALEATCMHYQLKADVYAARGKISAEQRNLISGACLAVAKSVRNDELDISGINTMLERLDKDFQPIFADGGE